MGTRFYSFTSAVDRRMKERQQEKMAAAEQAREMELLEAKDEAALALAGRQGKNALEQARLQQEGALEQTRLSEAGASSRQKSNLSFEQRKLEEEKRKTLLEKYNQMISPQYSKDGMLLSPGMSSKEALDKLSAGSTGIGMRFFGEEDITKTPKESPFLDSYAEKTTYDKEGNPYRTFTNSRSNLTKETPSKLSQTTPAKTTPVKTTLQTIPTKITQTADRTFTNAPTKIAKQRPKFKLSESGESPIMQLGKHLMDIPEEEKLATIQRRKERMKKSFVRTPPTLTNY